MGSGRKVRGSSWLLVALVATSLVWATAESTSAAPPPAPDCVAPARGGTPMPAGYIESIRSYLSPDGRFTVVSMQNADSATIIERRDLLTNAVTSVSMPKGFLHDVGADGHFALYGLPSPGFGQLPSFVVVDLIAQTTVPLTFTGGWTIGQASGSPIGRISDDGQHVVTEAITGTSPARAVVVDVPTGAVHQVSTGLPANEGRALLAASFDASVVAMQGNGNVIELTDTVAHTTVVVPDMFASFDSIDIVGGGRYVVVRDRFVTQVYDRTTDATTTVGGPNTIFSAVSENGRYFGFVTSSDGFVADLTYFVLDRVTSNTENVGNVTELRQFVLDIADDGQTVLVMGTQSSSFDAGQEDLHVTRVGLPSFDFMVFPIGAVRQTVLNHPLPDGSSLTIDGATTSVENVGGETVLTVAVDPTSEPGRHATTMITPDGCVLQVGSTGMIFVDTEFAATQSVSHPNETVTLRYRWLGLYGFTPTAMNIGDTAGSAFSQQSTNPFSYLQTTIVASPQVGPDDVVLVGATADDVVVFPGASVVRHYDGEFHPITPSRIVDTRVGTGGRTGALVGGEAVTFDVTGVGGVPNSGVDAVVLNATVDAPSDSSFLTVWPANQPRPTASNVNWVRNQVVPNLVTVKVSPDGNIAAYNNTGLAHVIFDVVGWYSSGQPAPSGTAFIPVEPTRLLDTREDGGPIGQQETIDLLVAEPGSGVSAVALNVTVTEPSSPGYVSVVPSGTNPTTSSLNFTAGQTVPNFVIVPVGADGAVSFYNNTGTAHVVVDIFGFFADGAAPVFDGQLSSVTPARVLDTRAGIGAPAKSVDPANSVLLDLSNRIPVDATSVVMNVTVTEPTGAGFVTVWPADLAQPATSNLNYTTGLTAANLVIVPVAPDGTVRLATSGHSAHIVADLTGWFGPIEH